MLKRSALILMILSQTFGLAFAEDGLPKDTLRLSLLDAAKRIVTHSPAAKIDQITLKNAELNQRLAGLNLYSPFANARFSLPSFQQVQTEEFVYNSDQNQTVLEWVKSENRLWQGVVDVTQPLPSGGKVRLESLLYRRNYRSDVTNGGKNDLEYRSTWRLSISQEVLRKSPDRVARENAELDYEKATHTYDQAQRDRLMQLVEAYFNLIAQQQELSINRDDLDAVHSALALAKRKYDSGLIPEAEVLLLEVESAQSEIDQSAAEAEYESNCDRFRDLLNLSPDQPFALTTEPEFHPVEVVLDSAIQRALLQREEAKSARISVLQSEMTIKDAKRNGSLSGELSAFYDLEQQGSALDRALTSDVNDYNVNRGIAFTVSVPLFGGGRRGIELQKARLALKTSEVQREQTRRQIVLDVRESLRAMNEARSRYELSLRSLRIAERSAEITRRRFESGQVTSRELIEAQITLKRSRLGTLRALVAHEVTVARMRRASGDDPLGRGVE